jgi:hypothetical protein
MELKRYTGYTVPARLYWGYMGHAHPWLARGWGI